MGCLSDLVWEMDAPGNGLLAWCRNAKQKQKGKKKRKKKANK